MSNSILADAFLDYHAPNDWFRDQHADDEMNVKAVDYTRTTELADALVDMIAHVVSAVIDAGSERDAVNESEALHIVIEEQLKSWTLHPHTTPNGEANALLLRLLHARFGYTRDNNRDLSDGTGSYESSQAEIDVTHAYLTIINYLTHQGD